MAGVGAVAGYGLWRLVNLIPRRDRASSSWKNPFAGLFQAVAPLPSLNTHEGQRLGQMTGLTPGGTGGGGTVIDAPSWTSQGTRAFLDANPEVARSLGLNPNVDVATAQARLLERSGAYVDFRQPLPPQDLGTRLQPDSGFQMRAAVMPPAPTIVMPAKPTGDTFTDEQLRGTIANPYRRTGF